MAMTDSYLHAKIGGDWLTPGDVRSDREDVFCLFVDMFVCKV